MKMTSNKAKQKMHQFTAKDVEDEKENNKKIGNKAVELIHTLTTISAGCLRIDDKRENFKFEKSLLNSVPYEVIQSMDRDLKHRNKTKNECQKNETVKRGIAFISSQDRMSQRFRNFSEDIKKSLAQQDQKENINTLNSVFDGRLQNALDEVQAIEVEVPGVKQRIAEAKADQEGKALETELIEKKNGESNIESIDLTDINSLQNLLQEYNDELSQLMEDLPHKSGKDLITQANASPMPFLTQAYNEPQHVRNTEHFVSQQAAKSTDLPHK